MTGTRRAKIAGALARANGTALSGERIAEDLGISRTAVAKHVDALRSLGYAIDAVPGAGYRLLSAPDACIPEEVWPRLADPLWVAVDGAGETGSTNDDAKRLARAGAPEGTLVVAGRQTGGRGRLGRTWTSPKGGVYASAVLRPPLGPLDLGPLPLVMAVGAARGLGMLGVRVGLKWPNDVLIGGRKLAGILLETAAEADRTEWVVAGFGVNVSAPADPGGVCVRDAVPGIPVADVAAAVLDGAAGAYRVFLMSGFRPIHEEYLALGTLWGRRVMVRDALGACVVEGEASGVDGVGALVVLTDRGTRHVTAGDVTLGDETDGVDST